MFSEDINVSYKDIELLKKEVVRLKEKVKILEIAHK